MAFPSWINSNGKSIILLLGFAFATEFAWRMYKKYGKSQKESSIETNKPISEVLFFSEQSALCRTHINYNVPCSIANCPITYLNKLIYYISSARRSLDVCVYFLTCNAIVKAILEAQKRNVFVRVITDDESSGNEASQVLNMRKAGVKVRSKQSIYLMHHKFAIIDRKILITGSANWTIQAFFGNYENVLITNQNELVSLYINEFDKLWLKYNEELNREIHNVLHHTYDVKKFLLEQR